MLFCFCLPFLKGCDGCCPPGQEMAVKEMYHQDSIGAYEAISVAESTEDTADTSKIHSVKTEIVCVPLEFSENKTLPERFTSAILQPNGDYSGLGLLVLGIQLQAAAIVLTLLPFILLVIVSLIISFRKENTYKWVFIFSAIQLICLSAFYILFYPSEILYGYWLTALLCLLNFIIAFFIWKKNRSRLF